MEQLQVISFFKNLLFCSLEKIEIFPWSTPDDTFYRLILIYKGYPFRVFINDIKVKKRSTYVCVQYDDVHAVKIKVRGILNSETYLIETTSISNTMGYALNLPKAKKSRLLKDKNINYGVARKPGDLQSIKKEFNKKLDARIFIKNSETVLKFKKNYSLNNTTHPTTWKN